MARGFGSTFGAGTTDIIVSSYSTLTTGKRSYGIWIYINGLGGGSLGRIWDVPVGTAVNDGLFLSTTFIQYQRTFSGGLNSAFINAPSSSVWHHILLTFDASSATNTPTIYVDGVLTSLSSSTGTTGTADTTSAGYGIGNRSSTGLRNFDGMLAHFAIWDGVLLGSAEAMALYGGINPINIMPETLVTYIPMDGVNNKEPDLIRGLVTTQTGTRRGTLYTNVDSPFDGDIDEYYYMPQNPANIFGRSSLNGASIFGPQQFNPSLAGL